MFQQTSNKPQAYDKNSVYCIKMASSLAKGGNGLVLTTSYPNCIFNQVKTACKSTNRISEISKHLVR
jgi:hypothetical protein